MHSLRSFCLETSRSYRVRASTVQKEREVEEVTYYIGIDPGITGAMVLINPAGVRLIPYKDATTISSLLPFTGFVLIEDVHAIRGDFGPQLMQFGRALGRIEGILEANGIEITARVAPQKWQLYFKLGGKWGEPGCSRAKENTARKNAHKRKAQELFPCEKITLQNCDAYLIAQYCYMHYAPEAQQLATKWNPDPW